MDNIEDYDDENLFFTRLKLLEDSKLYFPFLESCVNPTYITDEEYRQHLVKVISFIGMIVEDKGDYYDLVVDKKIQKVVEELKALHHDVLIRYLTYWSEAIDSRKYVVESDILLPCAR